MSNISLEELEESENLLLEAYNTMGSVTCNKFSSKTEFDLFLETFNNLGDFLQKMGISLVF